MTIRYSQYCLALALLATPAVASKRTIQVAPPADNDGNGNAAKSTSFVQAPTRESGYDLKKRAAPILALDTTRERRSPILNRSMAAQGALYGDGEMEYIEGPSVSYQRSSNGPVFEAGALGGGMETAPFLAHVAMNWTF